MCLSLVLRILGACVRVGHVSMILRPSPRQQLEQVVQELPQGAAVMVAANPGCNLWHHHSDHITWHRRLAVCELDSHSFNQLHTQDLGTP